DAGTHREHFAIIVGKHLNITRNFRPRTDEAHVPAQHVPKLRQLVELRLAEEMPNPRNPRISAGSYLRPALRRVDDHCAKFANPKRLEVSSDSLLTKQNRSRRTNFYRQRGEQQDRTSEDQAHCRENNIE